MGELTSRSWSDGLEELRAKGLKLQEESRATQRKVFELLAIPEHGAVTAVFDSRGLLEGLQFDATLCDGLTSTQLVEQINIAIFRDGGALVRQLDVPTVAVSDDDPASVLSPVVAQLMNAFAAGELPEPVEFTNDFKTITVTAILGTISTVVCDSNWIATTPERLISEEIVIMARRAALDTDKLGRFTEESRP